MNLYLTKGSEWNSTELSLKKFGFSKEYEMFK